MKKVFFILSLIATTFTLSAQTSFNAQAIEASEVPEEVLNSQANYFTDATVNIWEKQTISRNKSGDRYIANFQNNGQKARARYYKNGKGISATTYYTTRTMPSEIKTAASENYAGYTLTSGEQIQHLPSEKIYYRLRLRKGAKKMVVYLNENGEELSPDNVPNEVEEE